MRVPQVLAEVDVKHVALAVHHDVVVVPVPQAQNVAADGPSSTGFGEIFKSLKTDFIYMEYLMMEANVSKCRVLWQEVQKNMERMDTWE